jgi:hypothetical protein
MADLVEDFFNGASEGNKLEFILNILSNSAKDDQHQQESSSCAIAADRIFAQGGSSIFSADTLFGKLMKFVSSCAVEKKIAGFYSISAICNDPKGIAAEMLDEKASLGLVSVIFMGLDHQDARVRKAANCAFIAAGGAISPRSEDLLEIVISLSLERLIELKIDDFEARTLMFHGLSKFVVNLCFDESKVIPVSFCDGLISEAISSISEWIEQRHLNTIIHFVSTLITFSSRDYRINGEVLNLLQNALKNETKHVVDSALAAFGTLVYRFEFKDMENEMMNILNSLFDLLMTPGALKSKEIALRVVRIYSETYGSDIDFLLPKLIQLCRNTFNLSNNLGESDFEMGESDQPLAGESASHENKAQEDIGLENQMVMGNEKLEDESKEIENFEQNLLMTLQIAIEISKNDMIESYREEISILLDQILMVRSSSKLSNNSVALVSAALLLSQPDMSIMEDSFSRIEKTFCQLLSLISDFQNLGLAYDSCALVIQILERVNCKKIGGANYFTEVENAFIGILVECRKLNEADDSNSAIKLRNLGWKISKVVTKFAIAFQSEFTECFKRIYKRSLPYFPAKFEDHETSFNLVLCMIADVCNELKSGILSVGTDILPLFIRLLKHESYVMRHNAAYGLGTIFASANGAFKEYYDLVLSDLYEIASCPSDMKELLGARDNALSALAKMIGADPKGLPVEIIVPKILNGLPLIADQAENIQLYPALISALEIHPNIIAQNKSQLKKSFAEALQDRGVPEKTKSEITEFLHKHQIQIVD